MKVKFEREEKKISPKELEAFEELLIKKDLKLPEDYKKHMLKYNGGSPDDSCEWHLDSRVEFFDFTSIKYGDYTMEEKFLISRRDVLPESDIYIGDILGGHLCMSLSKENHGAIYAFFPDGERIDICNSFTEFVNGLVYSDEEEY
ncbi:MAG: SMI1/KNR4 family protein [Polaribacter sp.]